MFRKDGKVPAEIKKAKLEDWYSGLDDQSRIRISRYLEKVNTKTPFDFFMDTVGKAIADENCAFAVKLCDDAYTFADMTDYQRFLLNELLITAYFGCERYDDTKAACEANYELFPKIKVQLESDNGARSRRNWSSGTSTSMSSSESRATTTSVSRCSRDTTRWAS